MSRVLGKTVVLLDDAGEPHVYLAGEPVSDDVAERITNPAAWDDDGTSDVAAPDVNELTVTELEKWVGTDPARARATLDAERDRVKGPRSSLVAFLEEVAGTAG